MYSPFINNRKKFKNWDFKNYLKSYAYEIAQVNLSIALQTNDIALELQSRRALDELGADIVNKDGKEAIKLIG